MSTLDLRHGDCIEVMRSLPAASVDAVVTDPPYGIRFMGKAWDGADITRTHGQNRLTCDKNGQGSMEAGRYDLSNQATQAFQKFSEGWGREALRVLKPGGHLVSFASTRTYHRMVSGLEDAGFEIRDQLAWVFGSGFPKSSNQEGEWEGWGTALKPAWEPIVLARKPLIGTIPENLAAHRTGALNINACRVETDDVNPSIARRQGAITHLSSRPAAESEAEGKIESRQSPEAYRAERPGEKLGRWPANLCHDGSADVLRNFPETASGQQSAGGHVRNADKQRAIFGEFTGQRCEGAVLYGDVGSAGRFFYCAKASNADREAGLDGFVLQAAGIKNESGRGFSEDDPYKQIQRANIHPTVKPTDLMRWLCRLTTPPKGTILDPFMGSGSTGRGAVLEGFAFIGIERETAYIPIARARIIEATGPLFFDTLTKSA